MARGDFTEEVRPKPRPWRMGAVEGSGRERGEGHGHLEGELPSLCVCVLGVVWTVVGLCLSPPVCCQGQTW